MFFSEHSVYLSYHNKVQCYVINRSNRRNTKRQDSLNALDRHCPMRTEDDNTTMTIALSDVMHIEVYTKRRTVSLQQLGFLF